MPKQLLALLAAATLISSCQTGAMWQDRLTKQRPATAAEKAAIIEGARRVLKDPYSIMDAEISYFIPAGSTTTGNICIKGNAKNSFGAYTGRKDWFLDMSNNVIRYAWEGHPSCDLPGIRYQPFPEIYKLRNL
ncbi:hypothetical protein LJR030_002969 [Rhizobium sp. LjRoot30]